MALCNDRPLQMTIFALSHWWSFCTGLTGRPYHSNTLVLPWQYFLWFLWSLILWVFHRLNPWMDFDKILRICWTHKDLVGFGRYLTMKMLLIYTCGLRFLSAVADYFFHIFLLIVMQMWCSCQSTSVYYKCFFSILTSSTLSGKSLYYTTHIPWLFP